MNGDYLSGMVTERPSFVGPKLRGESENVSKLVEIVINKLYSS